MADADARALLAGPLGVRARIVDMARFMLRPSFAAPRLAWGRAAARALLVVIGFDLALDTLVTTVIEALDAEARFLPEALEFDTTLVEDVLSYLVFAPLLEELVYRGWLTGRIAALRFAVYGFAAEALMFASLFAPPDAAMPLALLGAAIAFAGLIHWGRTRRRDTAVPPWFTRYFHWIVWGSSLAFGLIHLGNYEPIVHPLGLLVVVPQALGGLLLAYTRTRFGLGAAMAHHAAYNAVWLAWEYGWW